jgi:succinate dehydrogenase flavin-adding protein (antitoxin of CptAB toxin-antitoxin module)
MFNRNAMVLALVRDEMNMVRGMSLDEMDEYVESLLVRIIKGLPDNELNENYEQLMNCEYNDFQVGEVK